MELALKIAPHHVDWSTMLEAWRFADTSGVYVQAWNFDHFYPIQGDTSGPCLEGWTSLAALAQATEHLRVGCLVTGIHHRHPAVLANMASTLDVVSGGRLELGLGAGWNTEESDAYGIPLGTLTERFDRFDEAVEVIVGLLAEPTTSFDGRYFRLTDARNEPKGPQQPLPICIGGLGERRTLRAVARWAHHWNLPFFDPDTHAHKREVLAGHCAELGREVDEIKVSAHAFAPDDAEPGAVVEICHTMAEAGLDQAIVYLQPGFTMAGFEATTAALDDAGPFRPPRSGRSDRTGGHRAGDERAG